MCGCWLTDNRRETDGLADETTEDATVVDDTDPDRPLGRPSVDTTVVASGLLVLLS